MALHVASSLDLTPDQTSSDLDLPKEIDQPFSGYKSQSRSPIHYSYQCPKCGFWKAACKGEGTHRPDWDMRRHLRDDCRKGPFKTWNSMALAEPCWTYRVPFTGGGSHVFVLAEGWADRLEEDETVHLPEFTSEPQTAPSISLRSSHQDWPLRLSWPAYDREITAADHIIPLRRLIMQPLPQKQLRSDLDTIEAVLHLSRTAIVKYFKSAMVFLHSKHKLVVEGVLPKYVL